MNTSMAVSVMLVCCASAHAEVQVCNEYREPLFVAIGWIEKGDTRTKGWWRVDTGACVVVDNRPLQRPHYFHLETSWHPLPNGSRTQQEWGNSLKLAVGKIGETFDFVHSQTIAADDNTAMFGNLDESQIEGPIVHVTLTINADGTTSKKYAL
jgi:hypothetical protein